MSGSRGRGKVAIVGVGAVGSATAFSILESGVVSELVLVDIDEEKAEGEAMDLNHGAYFTPPTTIRTGGYEDCWDADVVIVTAGSNQEPGETRLDLLERNASLFEEMMPRIASGLADDAVVLLVTNPVDVLSYVTWAVTDLPAERVIGSGTVLDTSRFRHVLSTVCDVDPGNVHGYIVGEHGDSEVPLWSSTNIAGVPIDEYVERHTDADLDREAVAERVRRAAYDIIERKGATEYAIALAATEIIKTVVRDEHSILSVSTLLSGEYGLDDVYLSVPCVVDGGGVDRVVERDLPPGESEALAESASVVADGLEAIDYR